MRITSAQLRQLIREELAHVNETTSGEDLTCPIHPYETLERVKKGWYCPECGHTVFDVHGNPKDAAARPAPPERPAPPPMTAESIINNYKKHGRRAWMDVTYDFHNMAMNPNHHLRLEYYPSLSSDDLRTIAMELDAYFGIESPSADGFNIDY